jgi:thiol:disulfide interchange protein
MKSIVNLKSVLSILFIGFGIASYAGEQEKLNVYDGSFESAVAYAKENNKPLFVKTYTEWCGWCKRMDSNTLGDAEVIAYLNANFVTLKIDAEKGEGPAFSEKYDAKRYPTILFFNPKGDVIHSFRGFKNARNFLTEANTALSTFNTK